MLRSSSIKSGGGDLKSSPGSGDSDPELFPCGPTAAPVSTATGPHATMKALGPRRFLRNIQCLYSQGALCAGSVKREKESVQHSLDNATLTVTLTGAGPGPQRCWALIGPAGGPGWTGKMALISTIIIQHRTVSGYRCVAEQQRTACHFASESTRKSHTDAETSCRYKFFWTTDLFSGLSSGGH
jgi:hypothetical protein